MIRPLTPANIPELIELQQETLPGSLPARFGRGFLSRYYEALLPDPRFFCDGFFWEKRLVGFLAYTSDSNSVFGSALRKRWSGFTAVLIKSFLARPARVATVMRLFPMLLGSSSTGEAGPAAELISLGVRREFRRSSEFFRDHRIAVAHELVHTAFRVLEARGTSRVRAYVFPAEKDPFINQFYSALGFTLVTLTKRFGLPCNLYVRQLRRRDAAERESPEASKSR